MSRQDHVSNKIPVFLLKTKSIPHDGYEQYFSTLGNFVPEFIPVLEHKFNNQHLDEIHKLLAGNAFGRPQDEDYSGKKRYGGLIFTSQRAVEGFARVIQDVRSEELEYHLDSSVPLYVVGPATQKTLSTLAPAVDPSIHGAESGNGEALASFILSHYNKLHDISAVTIGSKLPLLFLVGEQRRDIIPKTLKSTSLPPESRIDVHELVVYETGVMQSFEQDFLEALSRTDPKRTGQKISWVVVFSPTGCEIMLQSLGLLDSTTGRADERVNAPGARNTFIATIGPTTRDHLIKKFGFQPDVCAEKPTPEGVGSAILQFIRDKVNEI